MQSFSIMICLPVETSTQGGQSFITKKNNVNLRRVISGTDQNSTQHSEVSASISCTQAQKWCYNIHLQGRSKKPLENEEDYLPSMRAVSAVVPEEMSKLLSSAKAWSAFTKAFIIVFSRQTGKWESSTMNLRMFFLTNDAASIPPWPSNTCWISTLHVN